MFFLGDIHGEFDRLMLWIKKLEIEDEYIIQVGDFGLGFHSLEEDKKQLRKLNNFLKKRNIHLYAIRGNHDKPSLFAAPPFSFSHIRLINDYEILNLKGQEILFVGGAVSIDRSLRKQGRDWWKDEIFVLDETQIPTREIDMVVTHSAPNFCPPFGFSALVFDYMKQDASLRDDLLLEREKLARLYDKLPKNKLKYWIAGHFHQYHKMPYENTTFLLLDEFQFHFYESTMRS